MVNSKKIKLSDFVSNFIADLGVEHVFGVSGGASLHLIHSIADNPKLKFHCTHHSRVQQWLLMVIRGQMEI